ncbi:MAG: RDD family protein [Colwellia sp.]
MNYQGLDNQSFYKLPEGVSISLISAGITVRSCAYLYDFIIRSVIVVLFAFALKIFGESGTGMSLIVYFCVSWGYYIFFEAKDGRTPGKKKYNLRVVQDNGLPANLQSIIIRNLLRPADSFPFAYALGIVTMACGKEFKRIGDWCAGTMVIHENNIAYEEVSSENHVSNPNIILSTEEQKVVIAFAERSSKLSPARQVELANILSDKLQVADDAANEKLKQMAQFYVGQEI